MVKKEKGKEIRVCFINMNNADPRKYFPTRVLFDNFNIKIVNDKKDADIIFGTIIKDRHKDYLNDNKKNIVLSGENIYAKRNVLGLIDAILHKIVKDKKYKIVDFLDRLLPRFISGLELNYLFGGYLKMLKNIKEGKLNSVYFVLSNEAQLRNTVSFPFFLQDSYDELKKLSQKKANRTKIDKNLRFCVFIVASNSSRERVGFFRKLSRYKKIESYGKVMNNMEGRLYNQFWNGNPEINIFKKKKINRDLSKEFVNRGWKTNPTLFKNYKFVISFENSLANDYIGEKLPNVFASGAIPIYRGAPNVATYFNTKSFVNYEDYGSYEKMIKKIIEIDNDDRLYLKMAKESPFNGGKWPKLYDQKVKDLIKFYKKILLGPPK